MTEDQLTEIQNQQKHIGNSGEDFVLNYERNRPGSHPRVNDIRIVGRKDVGLGDATIAAATTHGYSDTVPTTCAKATSTAASSATR